MLFRAFILILVGLVFSNAHAFEVTTHAAITQRAWIRYIETDPELLTRLGLQNKDDAFNTNRYFDFRAGDNASPVSRNANQFERDIIRSSAIADLPFSVQGWLMRGAIREDDDSSLDDPSPKEDPFGDFHRVFSHFHDPVNNLGLTVGFTLGARAADWALDPAAFTPAFPPFSIPGVTPTPQRFNNFSLATFHESMWRAVTGQNQAGEKVANSAGDRNTYWATAFRSLGDILHLNQDMAQPQHTRNDPHAIWRFEASEESI